jgi:hypothetical protein
MGRVVSAAGARLAGRGRRPRRIIAALAAALVSAGVIVLLAATPSKRQPSPTISHSAFAGYSWSGQVTSVEGSWTVPRILAGSPHGYAATWIGAQAPGARGPFIQIGTNEEERVRHGPGAGTGSTPSYWAFWSDTDHHFFGQFLFNVFPGDAISARLVLAGARWLLTLTDVTHRHSTTFTTVDEADASFDDADWLQEHVMSSRDGYGYPRLSTVAFENLAVNLEPPSAAALSPDSMTLSGPQLLTPGPFDDDAFVVGQPETATQLRRAAPIARSAANAVARAIGLRASDLPGWSVSHSLGSRRTVKIKRAEAGAIACLGRLARARPVAKAQSAVFVNDPGVPTDSAFSNVLILPSASAVAGDLAAARRPAVRACARRLLLAGWRALLPKGDTVTVTETTTSPVLPGTDQTIGGVTVITARLRHHQTTMPVTISENVIDFSFGQAQVSVVLQTIDATPSTALLQHLAALLAARARAVIG